MFIFDTSVQEILDGTAEGLRYPGDYEQAQSDFRNAERALETLPARLHLHLPEGGQALADALCTEHPRFLRRYARTAAVLAAATVRVHPQAQASVDRSYGRLLSDLLRGATADTRAFWSAVWNAPCVTEEQTAAVQQKEAA